MMVMKGCFSVGLYRQGIMHDLSKYMPSEFMVGAKYYQGTQSPNNAERADKGYSAAWLHHKGRNRHHYEYWLDYSDDIPLKYYMSGEPWRFMHKDTRNKLEFLLKMNAKYGEAKTMKYIRRHFSHGRLDIK